MRSILITGGCGFFGRAFVKRLLEEGGYDRICILSRCEYKQATMMREEGFEDARLRWFLGDVRDRDRLQRAFEQVDVVVHAAALKRIETGHYNPGEMVKTNVLGAMNVIEAAADAMVERVVFLSTDKAFEPVSAYGQSKAIAETLFLAANRTFGAHGPRFAVTRYGNVAGSTGSVIPTWRRILEQSDTVPVTNPECTRFWMTSDAACDLVQDTIEDMPREPAIPDLPAFRLGDLAEAMGAKMRATGLGEYEKLHESMSPGRSSAHAPRLTVEDLGKLLACT